MNEFVSCLLHWKSRFSNCGVMGYIFVAQLTSIILLFPQLFQFLLFLNLHQLLFMKTKGAVTNQTTWNSIQRHWISFIVWFGWPAVWRKRQAKPTKKINFMKLIWFVGGVSWSAHQIQIKQINSNSFSIEFDWLLIEFACCSISLCFIHS